VNPSPLAVARSLLLRLAPVALALVAGRAAAQTLTDPTMASGRERVRGGGYFAQSKITYEGHHHDFDIDRTILGGDVSYGATQDVDVYGLLGFVAKTEVEDLDDDGKGFVFGFGVRGRVYQQGRLRASAYGQLVWTNEEIDGSQGGIDYDLKISTQALDVGGVAGFLVTQRFMPYAGVEIVPYNDGESKYKPKAGGSDKEDIDRDDILNLKFGASVGFGQSASARAELTLLGETTFVAGLSVGI
jgi:hypothetical protein